MFSSVDSQQSSIPYPGVIPHFNKDIDNIFHIETMVNGKHTTEFFNEIGLQRFAIDSGGLCTFRLGDKVAIYQITNVPLVNDDMLSPSTGPNKKLFGNFMGTLTSDDPERNKKRKPLLARLANPTAINELIPPVKVGIKQFLSSRSFKNELLEDFAIELVSYLDSIIPNMLDLSIKPLSSYLHNSQFKEIMRNFFELASNVISKLDADSLELTKSIVPFVKDLLVQNFDSIHQASNSNIIKEYFRLNHSAFNLDTIDSLDDDFIKELGTIIVAIYDTTSLSLYWLICYIENNPKIKQEIISQANEEIKVDNITLIEHAILESIRLAGNNPTALWREFVKSVDVKMNGVNVHVPKGTMLWLDRAAANRDENVFLCPHAFDPENIKKIASSNGEKIFSLLGHNRYEINSFSMVNTIGNPRKCPGRYFSVFIQSCIIRELYGNYNISTKDTGIALRRHCSMPRPDNHAVITLSLKSEG